MSQTAFDLLDEKYSPPPPLKVIDDQDPAGKALNYLDQDKTPGQSDPARVPDQKTRAPLYHWRDSWPVELFSSFLQEFNDQGISLKQTKEGQPVLCFNPGLKREEKDPERFSIALHACHLMDYARADLKELIDNDALHLQPYKGIWL